MGPDKYLIDDIVSPAPKSKLAAATYLPTYPEPAGTHWFDTVTRDKAGELGAQMKFGVFCFTIIINPARTGTFHSVGSTLYYIRHLLPRRSTAHR